MYILEVALQKKKSKFFLKFQFENEFLKLIRSTGLFFFPYGEEVTAEVPVKGQLYTDLNLINIYKLYDAKTRHS